MSWNGSHTQGSTKIPSRIGKDNTRRSSPVLFIVKGKLSLFATIIFLLAAFTLYYITHHSAPATKVEIVSRTNSTLAEVLPATIRTNIVKEVNGKHKKYADMSREEKLKYFRDKYGDNLPENLKPIVYYLQNPSRKTFKQQPRPYQIFKHRSEREIAALLLVEPGHWMMRAPTFDARFDADLAESFSDKIEITKDDSLEQSELKKAVIDAKKELAARIKAGEKASDILNESAEQLYRLGQYKRDLEHQLSSIQKDEKYTDKDVEDSINAANEMLKRKGLAPLKMPNMVVRRANILKRSKHIEIKKDK